MKKIYDIFFWISDRIRGWEVSHVGQQNFVVTLSLFVGLCSGLAAVVLKNTIEFVKEFVLNYFATDAGNYMLLVAPTVGILITLLFVRYVVRDNLGHGITKILYAISRNNSAIRAHHSYASIIASSFTIGFGGSVGAEAPIALTGASLGSNIGKLFRLDYKTITMHVACGAACGIAGTFKAPIAGMIFTLEILMLNLTLASIVPLLVSAITATSVTYYFLGRDVEFSFDHTMSFEMNNIPHYILLGIFAGFVSLFFTRSMWWSERKIATVGNVYVRWIVGGLLLGVLVFLFPPLYGEGYSTITDLLNNRAHSTLEHSPFALLDYSNVTLLLFLGGVLLFKTYATSITTGAGGVGGTFAPSLFLGGIAGYFFALANNMLGIHPVPTTNFTLVGMAGVMAGVMHAPLTSIFLIAEITNGYQLLVPLMIVSTVSYLTIGIFEKHSIYTKPLADQGALLTHERDKAVLTLMQIDKVIEQDFVKVKADASLGELVTVIARSQRNLFPVVNMRDELIGVVLLNDIRSIMFDKEQYATTLVRDVMTIPPDFVKVDEAMESVMNKFEKTGAWNLPVIDNRRYVGFVSKSKIFSVYRSVLMRVSYE